MTPKEVPKTVCAKTSSGTPTTFLKIAKKTGMMMIPPPIPKSPAKIPEKIPSKKYKISSTNTKEEAIISYSQHNKNQKLTPLRNF